MTETEAANDNTAPAWTDAMIEAINVIRTEAQDRLGRVDQRTGMADDLLDEIRVELDRIIAVTTGRAPDGRDQ